MGTELVATLAGVVETQRGVFYRRQALDCGYTEAEVAALVKNGEWRRVRRGAYTTRERAEGITESGWHLLVVRAVVGNLAGEVVVMGTSALAALGVPLWGVDLSPVQVARDPDKTARTDAGVAHHTSLLPPEQIIEVNGLLVARPELAVIDAARASSFEAGVVLADGARRRPGFDLDLAKSILESQRDWRGSIAASRVLRFSDPLAETVGESRSRVMLARLGLPKPQLQRTFERRDGTIFARTDFYFEAHRTVGEFDGRQKYGREMYERTQNLEVVDLGDILWSEKRREDGLRDEGNEVVRWVWSELDGQDGRMVQRFQAAFTRGAGRSLSA